MTTEHTPTPRSAPRPEPTDGERAPEPDARRVRDLVFEAEQFFYREADLLDERRYDDWLDQLHEDVVIFMPLVRNVSVRDRDRELSAQGRDMAWLDDTKEALRKRVAQLRTGIHWAEEPVSRVSHLVTNVRVRGVDGDRLHTGCRFLVQQNRNETETNTFVGKRRDTLVRSGDGWLLLRRELRLDQNVLLAKSLTVFL